MSAYSTDSLEDSTEISPRSGDSFPEHNIDSNLVSIKPSTGLLPNVSPSIKPNAALLKRSQDAGSNGTTPSTATDKDTRTAGSRNAIITSEGSADAFSRRRPASSRSRKRDVTDRLKRNSVDSSKQEEGSADKCVGPGRCRRRSRTLPVKRSCCSKEIPMPTKPDKKLGDALAPRIPPARKPRSYLELYRRGFSTGPGYNVRSPEGSASSVCGDSQRDQLADDDTCLPATPRDDRSELSFYRRLIEGSGDPAATTARSAGIVHQHVSEDTSDHPRLDRAKRDGDKSRSPGYRAYTIEEYRTLPIPKLDRSLGPDKVEMQAKREWLMRRRSYGNSVSARNRQRILLQAQKLEAKHGIAEEGFLPPLKDQEVDGKTRGEPVSSAIPEDEEAIQKNSSENCSSHSRKNVDVGKLSSSRKFQKFERTSSFTSSLNSQDIIEDSYLESLRRRHLHEKEMVDRIINQALLP
ncbi:uncharacterized protein LOC143366792 [Andrena cerasifolii]|uniref:uncharacterized protein LOC143366792 n=1 Tax=Andrena cerasifolii TaxID=2819439 RepID=UPI00403772DA